MGMYGKLNDMFVQAKSFTSVSIDQVREKGGPEAEQTIDRLHRCLKDLRTHLSIYSALATHRLSHGDNERMNRRGRKAAWQDMIVLRRELATDHRNLTGGHNLPKFRRYGRDSLHANISTESVDYVSAVAYVYDTPSECQVELLQAAQQRTDIASCWVTS